MFELENQKNTHEQDKGNYLEQVRNSAMQVDRLQIEHMKSTDQLRLTYE